jgi:hypothetical protein
MGILNYCKGSLCSLTKYVTIIFSYEKERYIVLIGLCILHYSFCFVVYDTPYARTDYPMNITHPAFPLPPTRFASLGRNPVQDGSNRMSPLDGSRSVDRGGYSSFVYPQNIIDMHLKEDVSGNPLCTCKTP